MSSVTPMCGTVSASHRCGDDVWGWGLPYHPDPTGAAVESHRNMVVAVAGGCAVAFVFIPLLIIFFLLTTRRCQRLRDKRHGGEWVKWLPTSIDPPCVLQVPPNTHSSLLSFFCCRCTPQKARGCAAPGQCLSQAIPNPSLPFGPQTQLGNPSPCPMGAHRTPSPMWLNPTSCASPNPADGNI